MNDPRLQIILAIIGSGVITTIINRIFANIDRKREKETVAVKAMRALLRVQIRGLGKRYISDGKIEHDDLEDILELWDIYHNSLGGNGYLDAIMDRVRALQVC